MYCALIQAAFVWIFLTWQCKRRGGSACTAKEKKEKPCRHAVATPSRVPCISTGMVWMANHMNDSNNPSFWNNPRDNMVLIVCLTRLKYQTEHLVSSYVLLGCGEYIYIYISSSLGESPSDGNDLRIDLQKRSLVSFSTSRISESHDPAANLEWSTGWNIPKTASTTWWRFTMYQYSLLVSTTIDSRSITS